MQATAGLEDGMDPLHVGALWLHTLTMVIVLGYYGILARVILPALRRTLDGPGLATTVPAVERRALPIVVAAIVVFIVTGVYLLLVDERYTGIGDFSNQWSTLMLVKHMVVLVMIGLGVVVDRLAREVGEASEAGRAQAVDLLVLAADGTVALGAIVLLLTAIAQLG
jgi:uncharacterized membrane protein